MTKEKQKAVFEFIFSHKNNFDMWIASAFCTEPEVPNGNQYGVPFSFSLSEARSILVLLKEKGLMTQAGDIFGEPYYHIHQAKDTEWRELIASTQEISAEAERAKKLAAENEGAERTSKHSHKEWYERPIGLVIIGVVIFIISCLLAHFFPQWFHS